MFTFFRLFMTSCIIPGCCAVPAMAGILADCCTAWSIMPGKINGSNICNAITSTPQIRNCTNPTAPIPKILPIISWYGFTLLTITSAIRLVFSSITPRFTIVP